MARDLEQDDTRDDKAELFKQLLVDIDAAFLQLQNQVTLLTTFRQAVIDDQALPTPLWSEPEDLTKVTLRLTERRDAIGVWYNGLPGG